VGRITQKGRHAFGEHRFPSRYRLTYLAIKDRRLNTYTPPTDEWAQIRTKEQLDVRLQTIERELAERRKTATARWHRIMERKEQIRSTPEKHFARRKNAPAKPDVPGCKNAPTSLGAELNPLPSIYISMYSAASEAPVGSAGDPQDAAQSR
jgi:hypothetical protein